MSAGPPPGSRVTAPGELAGTELAALTEAHATASPRRHSAAFPGLATIIPVLLLVWCVVVAALGARLALDALVGPPVIYIWPDIATRQGLLSAALVYLVCLAAATLTRWRRPAATLPVTLATGVGIVVASALATREAGALTFVAVSGALSMLIGWLLLIRLPHAGVPPSARAPLAMALGIGVLGLLFFGLGSFGFLNALTVPGSAGLLTIGLLLAQRQRLDLQRLQVWRPPVPSWFETIVLGATVGLIAFASLIALVPETISDPVWQHMPIAREIWQTGSIREFAHLEVSRDPIQAHVLYAVGYGLGGLPTIKLLHALAGLGAISGIAALGLLLAGRGAAIASAAVFVSMPLTLWLLGHALIDFFTVFFVVTALMALVLWQRTADARWPLVAGVLMGIGLGAKLNMLPLIGVLGVALFLAGRQPGAWRGRVVACAAFSLGTLVALPWVLRGVLANGTLSPKFQVVINALAARFDGSGGATAPAASTPAASALHVYDPQAFALGQSPLAMLRIPWFFTFHADEHRFLVIGRGEIGILLLLLLPLVFFMPRSRASALVALTALLSYVAWVFTPFQIIRHLLPTFAFVAILAGAAVGSLLAHHGTRAQQALGVVVRGGVLLGLAVAPVFFLFGVLTQVPVDFLLGRESAAAYVERSVPAAVALEAASALPPDTPVVYFGRRDGGAQIYSEARLLYVEPNNTLSSLGASPAQVLASLEALGVDHVIWNRPATTTDDWRATVLSLPFLRDHARIIAGDRNAYLFEIAPTGKTAWDKRPKRTILQDPNLKRVTQGIGPWETTGHIDGDRGLPTIPHGSLLAQRAPVAGGQAYLLVASATCPDPTGSVDLTLRWFASGGQEIGRDVETVVPGTEGSEQFLWRRAPAAAASVSVELATAQWSNPCAFDAAALYPQP